MVFFSNKVQIRLKMDQRGLKIDHKGLNRPLLTIALKILKTIEKPLVPMVGPHEIYIRSTDTTAGGARAWGRSWQKRPVRPFQLQLCQLLPVAASISASTRCMWIPVHFGVHFGVHFAFFLETWGEGKQDGRPAPWNPRLLRNRQLCVELFKQKTF